MATQFSTQTVTVTTQPGGLRNWNSSLFSCFDDIKTCLCGCCCSCCLAIQVATRMGESCLFPLCCPGALLAMRAKLRGEQNIQGDLCNDAIVVECCGPCALCQMSRELDILGR
ncbi:cornifelin homolog B-like [Dendronephthya gigantea]|uniref:cornifelin homolog B-like n=1 Tax=Dendronephthya gigantea TaxID=151771 RepID=UPI00106D64D0|nr:cornifelin homolog B-like [Dendronephthya gigantea]